MPDFRCLRLPSQPATLPESLFPLTDGRGRHWICLQEEDSAVLNEQLGSSEWAWGYYMMGLSNVFAAFVPGAEGGGMDNVGRVFDATHTLKAADRAELATLLAGKP